MNSTHSFFSLSLIKSIAVIFFLLFTFGQSVYGAEADRFSGWAWSENIGWISFNCSNTSSCATVDYGVTSSGNSAVQPLSGWAWAPNIGWIDFSQGSLVAANRSMTGEALAHVTIAEPFCNPSDPFQTNASGAIGPTGGAFTCTDSSEDDAWDGVISLSSGTGITYAPIADATDDSADGWNWPDTQFYLMDDFAWGGDVVGWTKFSCQDSDGAGPDTNTCGTVGYGVFMDPFFFEFTADQGLTTSDKVDYEGSFSHIWTLNPDTEIVSCTASGGPGNWSTNPVKATNPSPLSQLVSNALLTATSTLSCTNIDNKTLTRNTLIYVKRPPPSLTFTADDYNIGFGSSANLDWTTENIADCTASAGDAGWNGLLAIPNGSYTSGGLTVDTTFNMTCNSPYPVDYPNPLLGTLEITIQRLIVNFFVEDDDGNPVDPSTLNAYTDKDNINLVWETEFATQGCVASGDWSGTKVVANPANDIVDGTELATIPDGGTFTYILTCQGELGQEITRTVSLRITRNPEFTEDITQ